MAAHGDPPRCGRLPIGRSLGTCSLRAAACGGAPAAWALWYAALWSSACAAGGHSAFRRRGTARRKGRRQRRGCVRKKDRGPQEGVRFFQPPFCPRRGEKGEKCKKRPPPRAALRAVLCILSFF